MNKEYLEDEENYFLQELAKTYSVEKGGKKYILEIWKSDKYGFQLRSNPYPENFGESNWHTTEEDAFDRGFDWFQNWLKEQ